ncbi:site-specific integrase [Methylobacter sp. S3L5C]|uniref:tyrosine-type recombinase/integrase n=1 Tax=Methylobacter sp. S3L5C TaxID=2839024 RepID=UPI001FAD838E|nr:site-specific integrase [Methylobacter sp. S3L5C]UOA10261.1 tyrosine-type recombinase/integrase [Methylobacter sp. S3L5C]
MAITTLELDALKPKSKPYIIREKQHDKKDGTLAFKVLPSGDIDGYFIYYVDRKEKQKKIGRYGKGSMSLKAIRDKYTEFSKEYQSGTDIKEQALVEEAAEVQALQEQAIIDRKKQMQGSFEQLVSLYLEHVEAELSGHHYGAIKKAYSCNLQGFDSTIKASDITKQDIISIIHPIIARGSLVAANRMRAYLSAMFKWGIEFDDELDAIKNNVQFYIESNPVTYVKKPLKKEAPTDRFLTESEVRTFWAALNKSAMSPHRANVFRLMLALGCRVEALSGLRWTDIDWNERLLTIPPARSKNGAYWVIPINDIAYDVLISNPKLNNEFLFPAKSGTEPLRLDGYAKAITRTCKQFSIESFTPKDLRTTFKTLAGMAGLSKEVRDRIQNHALTDVSSKHYDRYDYLKEKRHAMIVWNDYLQRVIDGVSLDDNVVLLRKGGA